MTELIDTIVIGGGQAGLSVSWHLQQAGCDHLVLDRGQTGDTWRRRWDSFCLVTPNRFCRLPGYHYRGDDPDGFMQRDEIVAYVENFAASFDPAWGGFGNAPKFPRPAMLELLTRYYRRTGDEGALTMVEVTLEKKLAAGS